MKTLSIALAAFLAASATVGYHTPLLASDKPEGGYPTAPVTLVVPFATGGSTDLQARLVSKAMEEVNGENIVVVNRPGAAGTIGARFVANSEPDGYTLLFGTTSLVSESVLNASASFDILQDFRPVSIVTTVPFMVVVSCSSGIKSLADLISAAKEKPGDLNYSSWGYGSTGNILGEMFKLAAGVDIVHIPYDGEAPAAVSVMAGESELAFLSPLQLSHVRSGSLCPLAITGGTRMAALPDVPTIEEAGIEGVRMQLWSGVMVPAGVPDEIVDKLSTSLAAAIQSDGFVKSAESMSLHIVGSSPDEFKTRIETDTNTVRDLSQKTNLSK